MSTWNEEARWALVDYLVENNGKDFIAPQVRAFAEKRGLGAPPDDRRWGAVMLAAKRAGLIVSVGYTDHNDERAHTRPVTLWRSAA